MKVKAYLSYYSSDYNVFDASKDFYKTSDDYIKAINDNSFASNKSFNSPTNVYKGTDGQEYRYPNTSQESEDKVEYTECEAILCDKSGNEKTVDDFISDYVSQDVQLYVLKFDLDNCDPDFEEELNLWYTEHDNIQKCSDKHSNEWILNNEPKVDVFIVFKNKANETKYAKLSNCKIMEKQKLNIYILLVEQVNLIDKFN